MPLFRVYSRVMLLILFGPAFWLWLWPLRMDTSVGENIGAGLAGGAFAAFWLAIPVFIVLALVKSAFRL